MKNTSHAQIAHFLLRITMGVNLLGHGLSRIPKIPTFRDWMIEQFQHSLLPQWTVYAWGSVLPFLEFIIGALLILGIFTYRVAIIGAFIILILIFGSCLIENWEWAGTQMLYALFFYFIITNIDKNQYAIDRFLEKKDKNNPE